MMHLCPRAWELLDLADMAEIVFAANEKERADYFNHVENCPLCKVVINVTGKYDKDKSILEVVHLSIPFWRSEGRDRQIRIAQHDQSAAKAEDGAGNAHGTSAQ